jgi:uncharacterized protein YjbJ (UPF0337 family)
MPTNPKENIMKLSTKHDMKGRGHEVIGAVKQAAGKATGNRKLEGTGAGEKLAGTAMRKIGQVEKRFGK